MQKKYTGTMTLDMNVTAETEDEAVDKMYERLTELISSGISSSAFGSYLNHCYYTLDETMGE